MSNIQIIVRYGKEYGEEKRIKYVVARYQHDESSIQLLERAAIGIRQLKYIQRHGYWDDKSLKSKTFRNAIYDAFNICNETEIDNNNSIDLLKRCEDIIDQIEVDYIKKYHNSIEVFRDNVFDGLINIESLLIDFYPESIKYAFINTPIMKTGYYIGDANSYFNYSHKNSISISEKTIDECRSIIGCLKKDEKLKANSKELMPECKTIIDYIKENAEVMTEREVEQFVNFNYEWERERLCERITDSDEHVKNHGKYEEEKTNMNVENNNYIEKKADLKMLKTDSNLYINISNIEYMKIGRNLGNINLKNIDADVDDDVRIYVKMQLNDHEIEGWKFGSLEDAERFLESVAYIVNGKK